MRLRPRPPAVPPELLHQFGEPEQVFGPNLRFRVVAAVCGVVFVVMGVLLYPWGPGAAGARLPLAISMLVFGAFIFIATRLVPMNWIFVCPRGLIRTWGAAWDGVAWAEVDRFEDASLTHRAVAVRQCRIVLNDGTEWGFLADHIAGYGRLTALLRRKVDEWRDLAGAGGPPAAGPV